MATAKKATTSMPRTLLRYAIEKLTEKQRLHYMGMKKGL